MEINLQNLSKEDLGRLKGMMLSKCRDYEPWADQMFLGGAGDPGVDHFPLDLFSEEIETITISRQRSEEPQ